MKGRTGAEGGTGSGIRPGGALDLLRLLGLGLGSALLVIALVAFLFFCAVGIAWASEPERGADETTRVATPSQAAPTASRIVAAGPTGTPAPAIRFVEVGALAGARYVHGTRDFGDRHKAEVLEMFTDGGAAVAVADVDGDGDDDLFLVDSAEDGTHRLLLNDGVDEAVGDGVPSFRDVTATAGVGGGNDASSICSDALFFDYDGDGLLDLLVGRFGTPLLWRNVGAGDDGVPRFEDVSARVGLTQHGNTLAMIVFDADGDGWLDLLLGNYFAPFDLLALETTKVLPNNLDYADNGGGVTFWRNVPTDPERPAAGRRFVERTKESGFAHHTGWTLDLGHGDLDDDGDQDVYLAGDYGTDRLFLNDGDGTFSDVTEEALGFDTRKGMNVDLGDADGDGRLDIYVTNITDEYMKECNMLWVNQGVGPGGVPTFLDLSRETGTCDSDWGWAAKFADFDHDGWLDLLATNGLRSGSDDNYIPELLEKVILRPDVDFSDVDSYPDIGARTWSGYQRNRLFHGLGDGTFREMAADAGIDNDFDGRGLGLGDFDLDGRVDVVQTSARQPSLLYLNRSEGDRGDGHWLALRLEGEGPNHQAIGARIEVRSGGRTWVREIDGGNGYASSSSRRVHVGLGDAAEVDAIHVRWPDGREETFAAGAGKSLSVNRFLTLRQGRSGDGPSLTKP